MSEHHWVYDASEAGGGLLGSALLTIKTGRVPYVCTNCGLHVETGSPPLDLALEKRLGIAGRCGVSLKPGATR